MPVRVANTLSNPNKKSLRELSFPVVDEDGVTRNVPALDKHWAPRKIFANYTSLVASGGCSKSGVALEEWRHEAESFRDDMEYLLSLAHHEFWSYVVHQRSVLASIVSFLQRATPFYINVQAEALPENILTLYEYILNLVLRIICRLVTSKESPKSWIDREQHRELIYKNYLISVPMLFDVIVAVGDGDATNTAVLRKIFQSVLKIEPNYRQDLLAALGFFRTAFNTIQTQTENEGFEGAGGGLLDENMETPFDDVVLYTLDCAYSLSVLLEVCPEMRSACCEMKVGQSIAHFYDNTLPLLYKNIFLVNEDATSLAWLNQARLQLIRAFRSIVNSYLEEVLIAPEASLLPSENLIGLLTECLSEQTFVVDYERQYPVALDVEILKQACKDLDDFKVNFVVQGYQNEADSKALATIGNIEYVIKSQTSAEKPESSVLKEEFSQPQTNGQSERIVKVGERSRDIEAEVTMVLDCLPHLGTGFVRRLLARYDNSEEVIAAILEDNLPPDLAQADRNEVYIPVDPEDQVFQQTGVRHFNVFDGDAYDVMTQDNPQCIIKQGKGFPNTPKNALQLLDDKRDLAAIRHRYQEYTLVAEDDRENEEYDDEFDDSYEALLESETRVVKSKGISEGLANVQDVSDDESESTEDEESQEDSGRRTNANDQRMNFCENPEVTRARYEANRQAKLSQKKQQHNQQQQRRDVVGNAKGQGQDKETLRNRYKKEINKASRANHNRKAGAAFKRKVMM